MIETFKKMTLTRKIVVCFILLLAGSALLEGKWIGTFITIWISYLAVKLSEPQSTEYHQEPADSDDDWYRHQQEEDDAYSMRQAEEERVNEENRMNQEALDRLL